MSVLPRSSTSAPPHLLPHVSPPAAPEPAAPGPPGTDAPPTCEVPHFDPVRVRGAGYQVRRLLRHRQRALAAGLAVTAAALVAAGPRGPADTGHGERARGHPVAERGSERRDGQTVTAPVRIAEAATVTLLRPGDRVDVIAAPETTTGGDAEVVARGAVVAGVPGSGAGASDGALDKAGDETGVGGALVVLSVPRSAAARLVGAGATARLAVALW
ncbi:hypothetical protein ACIQAC_38010 [Streptomyces sp. NPDC088387]|uniref:hypothetical protein n=1 Tax=Streptomyces sp. NPDC088387 TaxID=3365859 RepID=UPI0037FB68F5